MAFHLESKSIKLAVRHLCRYGDTDIFPHLYELAFISDEQAAVISELTKLDLDSYTPNGAIEALAPKSRFGFRIAHQLPALESILFLACVIEIGKNIEAKRQSLRRGRAYSYRYATDVKAGQLFRPDRTYKDWLLYQQKFVSADKEIVQIVSTDISDYYSRINFHRIENLLDEVAPKHGTARFIKRQIEIIRAKQSFGLPVGGSAARLLAELALTDTDQALRDQGLKVTRFVDDFRIFLKRDQSAYDALGYLAEQLGINEGLSLNVAKTSVTPRRLFLRRIKELTSDIPEESEGISLDALTSDLYFDDDPDEKDISRLRGMNLVKLLQDDIKAENWGTIRLTYHADGIRWFQHRS